MLEKEVSLKTREAFEQSANMLKIAIDRAFTLGTLSFLLPDLGLPLKTKDISEKCEKSAVVQLNDALVDFNDKFELFKSETFSILRNYDDGEWE